MNSRGLRILLLLFVTVWFGAIVPGHTRGVVRLPGTASVCEAKESTTKSCCPSGKSKEENAPAKSCCAVCFFAAGLMHVPPVEFDFAKLGLVGSLAPPLAERVELSAPFLPYNSRGPPAVV